MIGKYNNSIAGWHSPKEGKEEHISNRGETPHKKICKFIKLTLLILLSKFPTHRVLFWAYTDPYICLLGNTGKYTENQHFPYSTPREANTRLDVFFLLLLSLLRLESEFAVKYSLSPQELPWNLFLETSDISLQEPTPCNNKQKTR